METIGDLSLEIWTTYGILANVAEARGDGRAARAWRRKEQAAYAAFPGNWALLAPRWKPVVQAVAAAAQGNVEAQKAVAELLEQGAQRGWPNLVAALRQVLVGERGVEALGKAHNRTG